MFDWNRSLLFKYYESKLFLSWNLESVSKIGFFLKIEVQTSVFDWNRSLAKLAEFFLAKESKRLEKNLPFLRILNTRHFVDRT